MTDESHWQRPLDSDRLPRIGSRARGERPDPRQLVADVLAAVRGTSVTELEIEWEGGSLRLRRDRPQADLAAVSAAASAPPVDDPLLVRSPYVGIFHLAEGGPSPGDQVDERTRLGDVETLGIRNAVTAPVQGELLEILVANHTPVEYGQPLAVIRPGAAADV